MNVILKLFLCLYIETFMSVLIHELFHLLAAVCMGIGVEKVQIGKEDLLSFSINEHLAISLVMCGGYVDVKFEELIKKGKIGIYFFGCAGSLGNIAAILIAIFVKRLFVLYRLWALMFNACVIVTSILPFFKGDAFVIRKLLLEEKSRA